MSHVILNQANPFSLLGPEFYGFLLPWIFTFAIVYGLIVKANIFGDQQTKKIGAALAFVAAFFVTAVGGPQLAAFFTTLFGGASIFLAGILVVIIFVAMVDQHQKLTTNVAVLGVLILIAIFLFLSSSGTIVGISIDSQTATLIFWGVILLAVVWYIMKPEGGQPAGGAPKPNV